MWKTRKYKFKRDEWFAIKMLTTFLASMIIIGFGLDIWTLVFPLLVLYVAKNHYERGLLRHKFARQVEFSDAIGLPNAPINHRSAFRRRCRYLWVCINPLP